MPDNNNLVDQTQVLAQIGALLSETRKEKGLTIEVAQEETKIRRYYLEALEQGARNALPGEVYLKGFLKNYANFLGLPGEELVRRYSQSKSKQNDINSPPTSTSPWTPIRRRFYNRALLPALLMLILVAAVFMLTKVWNTPVPKPYEPPSTNQSPIPSSPDTSYTKPSPEEEKDLSLFPDDVQTKIDTPEEVVYQATGPLQIEITITTDRCWMAVRVDDSAEISETLVAGSNRTFTANNKIWLRAGNAGVVSLSINDVHIGAVGKTGQPRNITIERKP
ncbi:MAG TPA: helix-turn-helix domain-containing protein [Firmicutes bacterium]|nr:helix-turn-helix domain-containing protein [Bacillota bacterium]